MRGEHKDCLGVPLREVRLRLKNVKKVMTVMCVILLLVLCYVHQDGYATATPCSRLAMLHAICGERVIEIDKWARLTPDRAKCGEHYYSDKAPGTAALALPAFWAAAQVLEANGTDLESDRGWLATSWAACAFSQALPAAIGAALLFGWVRRFVSDRVALVTVLALWLGGMPLPYSTLLFSHAQVIGLIAIAIWAVGPFGAGSWKLEAKSQRSDVRLRRQRREGGEVAAGVGGVLFGAGVGE